MTLSNTLPTPPTSAFSLPDVVEGTLHLVSRTLDVRLSMLTRIEGSTSTISAVVDRHEAVRPGTVFPLADTFCLHMLQSGETTIRDTASAKYTGWESGYGLELDIRSYAGVPIYLSSGQIYGTLCCADAHARDWTDEQITALRLLARLLGHELSADQHERRAERRRKFSAAARSTDTLTGLIAGPAFENQLRAEERRLQRYGGLYSVAVLELDRLAEINENQGPAVGAQLVQGIASVLMLNSRILDSCARLEGGRFAVLFPETPGQNIPVWQRRIEASLQTWNLLHAAIGVPLRFRIGIADSKDMADHQAVLALATERMLTSEVRPA